MRRWRDDATHFDLGADCSDVGDVPGVRGMVVAEKERTDMSDLITTIAGWVYCGVCAVVLVVLVVLCLRRGGRS